MSEPQRIELRLLGGFEARLGSEAITGFESQKTRALLAYLVLGREKPTDREKIATLLWGERSEESARRNLRQALYSIRASIADVAGDSDDIVVSSKQSLSLHPEVDCWTDVEEFEVAFESGMTGESPDPQRLSTAARLYKGDFLAGFYLRECPDWEAWQFTRQEELRNSALEVFRTLVEVYLVRGEHRYGIRYAKRLLSIDPLSEEGHRQLMRLYVLANRRTRALAQYEQLLNLLRDELGVQPTGETTEIYHSILLASRTSKGDGDDDSSPPLVPLVGRREAHAFLENEWETVASGTGRVTWITGEAGVGKSRLAKSFVDGATSKRHAVVLRGHCHAPDGTVPYRPFTELLGSALLDVVPEEEVPEQGSGAVADLVRLAAAAGQLPPTGVEAGETVLTTPEAAAANLLDLVDLLSNPRGEPSRPLILLLEDFQWADAASRRVLDLLATEADRRSLWILVTSRTSELAADVPHLDVEHHLDLQRLRPEDIDEIAASIVAVDSVAELSFYLRQNSEGLPLKITELVNLLWDEKLLRPLRPGTWDLRLPPAPVFDSPPSLSELIQRRVRALPASARRLIAVAAVYGHQFDVEILRSAADEHLGVVETCIELALERWLIRQFPRSWSPAGLERDIVLWARGARRGYFEFSHDEVRSAVLEQINPIRRAAIHRDLALAIEEHLGAQATTRCENLAYHWLEAQEAARALPWLERAARVAADRGAPEVCDDHAGKALRVIGRLEHSGGSGHSTKLEELRERFLALQSNGTIPD